MDCVYLRKRAQGHTSGTNGSNVTQRKGQKIDVFDLDGLLDLKRKKEKKETTKYNIPSEEKRKKKNGLLPSCLET